MSAADEAMDKLASEFKHAIGERIEAADYSAAHRGRYLDGRAAGLEEALRVFLSLVAK